jgi:hypothetical protein
MKTLRLILTTALASLCLATASAYGAMFDFSYQFPAIAGYQPKLTVWGSLTGDLSADGNFVNDVSILSVNFNGVSMPSPVVAPGSVVSYNAQGNNFMFSDLGASDRQFWQFEITPTGFEGLSTVNATQYGYLPIPAVYGGTTDANSWSLTPVPEPTTMIAGALALLLPLGAGALRGLRKNRKQAA